MLPLSTVCVSVKPQRYRYPNADMAALEEELKKAQKQRFRLIVTDGVFSMDGNTAPVDKMVELAEKYDAMVMVDECHSAGVVGNTGRGVSEHFDIFGKMISLPVLSAKLLAVLLAVLQQEEKRS